MARPSIALTCLALILIGALAFLLRDFMPVAGDLGGEEGTVATRAGRPRREPGRVGATLEKGIERLRLRVLDREGKGIAGAGLRWSEVLDRRRLALDELGAAVLTDRNGLVDGLPARAPGGRVLIAAEAAGYESRSVVVEARGEHEIVLGPGFETVIELRDFADCPIVGARVCLAFDRVDLMTELRDPTTLRPGLPGAERPMWIAITDAEGRASFSGLGAGRYAVELIDLDHVWLEVADDGESLVVVPGSQRRFRAHALAAIAVAERDVLDREIIAWHPLLDRSTSSRGGPVGLTGPRAFAERLAETLGTRRVALFRVDTFAAEAAPRIMVDYVLEDGRREDVTLTAKRPSQLDSVPVLGRSDQERGASGRVRLRFVTADGEDCDGSAYRIATDWPGSRRRIDLAAEPGAWRRLPVGSYRVVEPRWCAGTIYNPDFEVLPDRDQEIVIRLVTSLRRVEVSCRENGLDRGFGGQVEISGDRIAARFATPIDERPRAMLVPVGSLSIRLQRAGFLPCEGRFEILAGEGTQRVVLELVRLD